jgi:hypothetical protein
VAWTPTDINSSGFGVAVSYRATTINSVRSVFIDYISITVYYTDTSAAASSGVLLSLDGGATQQFSKFAAAGAPNSLQLPMPDGQDPTKVQLTVEVTQTASGGHQQATVYECWLMAVN